jgi:hypothetical protein
LDAAELDMRLTVYVGPNCNALQCVDQAIVTASDPGPSLFRWSLEEGARYYLLLESSVNETGSFDLSLSEDFDDEFQGPELQGTSFPTSLGSESTSSPTLEDPFILTEGPTALEPITIPPTTVAPPNDACADSIRVLFGEPVTGFTTGSTQDIEVPSCGSDSESMVGVWYRFRPLSGDPVEILLDPEERISMKIFVGPNCNNLECLDQIYVDPEESTSYLWDLQQGLRHYILIESNSTGQFNLTVDEIMLDFQSDSPTSVATLPVTASPSMDLTTVMPSSTVPVASAPAVSSVPTIGTTQAVTTAPFVDLTTVMPSSVVPVTRPVTGAPSVGSDSSMDTAVAESKDEFSADEEDDQLPPFDDDYFDDDTPRSKTILSKTLQSKQTVTMTNGGCMEAVPLAEGEIMDGSTRRATLDDVEACGLATSS